MCLTCLKRKRRRQKRKKGMIFAERGLLFGGPFLGAALQRLLFYGVGTEDDESRRGNLVL